MAAYGVDITDPAAVSPRRLAVLLDGLPPYARRVGQAWSVEAELLASLIDSVAVLTYVTARAAGAKNYPRPRPVPRPGPGGAARSNETLRPEGRGPGEGKTGTWAEAAAILGAIPGVVVTDG